MTLSSFVYMSVTFIYSPFFFFFNDTATTEIYTLSLHDALPILSVPVGDVATRLHGVRGCELCADERPDTIAAALERVLRRGDRKSTRLNSSHSQISYAVFCLKKKKKT